MRSSPFSVSQQCVFFFFFWWVWVRPVWNRSLSKVDTYISAHRGTQGINYWKWLKNTTGKVSRDRIVRNITILRIRYLKLGCLIFEKLFIEEMKSKLNIVTRHVQSGFFGRLSFSFRPVFIYFEFLSFLWVNNVFIKSSFHSKKLTYHWHILSFFWCFKEKMNKCKNTKFSMSPQRSMGQKNPNLL